MNTRVAPKSRRKNSIKTHKVIFIILQSCQTCQTLCKFMPKINVNVLKPAHRQSSFLKKLILQEMLVIVGWRKSLLQKFQNFGQVKCFVNFLSMLSAEVWSHFTEFLSTWLRKHILESALIVVTHANSRILDIEGHSNT